MEGKFRFERYDGGNGEEYLFSTEKDAMDFAIRTWQYLTREEQKKIAAEEGSIFMVTDSDGHAVWDFIDAADRAKSRADLCLLDIDELGLRLRCFEASRGVPFTDAAANFADSWDGTEETWQLATDLTTDGARPVQDDVEALMDCIAVYNDIREKEEQEEQE